MIVMRTFDIWLYDVHIDTMYFIGEEYNPETVKAFLIENEAANKNIIVKQTREVVK